MVEEAAHRLEANDESTGDGGCTEDAFITVKGLVAAVGVDLRERISHALGKHRLEELVESQLTDLAGLQVGAHVFSRCFGRTSDI